MVDVTTVLQLFPHNQCDQEKRQMSTKVAQK